MCQQFDELIQKMLGISRQLRAQDSPDVYVLTDRAKELLTREMPVNLSDGFQIETLCGIPFESYPTLQQALDRVSELIQSGKAVALISE